MNEIAVEKQKKINQLLSELLEIKNDLDSKMKALTPDELDTFEIFVSTNPDWWELEEKENELRQHLGFN